MTQERKIVLASASPRRKELLRQIGLKFEVDPSKYPEESAPGLAAEELVQSIALNKARAVAGNHANALVIAADTIGVLRGEIIGKPHNPAEAAAILRRLSAKTHRVITGLTIIDTATGKKATQTVQTRVRFKKLSDRTIERYVASGEPLDKAGAYAIQGLGAVLIEKIDGDYSNVVGLPLAALAEMLREFGVEVL